MVVSQEISGTICQLRWPGFQSIQIQLLEQFLLPLLHGQLWCWEALCLPYHLHYTGLHRGLWYPCDCNCPHHWGLLHQSLGICHTISHYHGNILAAILQLHVSVLHCEALGWRSILSMRGLSHHIYPLSSVHLPHPCMYDMGWEGITGLSVLGGNHFILFTRIGLLSSNLVISHCGCSSSNCQKIGHPGFYPRHCQGIYLFLLDHIHNAAYHGSPQDERDPSHKVWQVQDHQGYLVFVITLDSIHLNPYGNVAHGSS